MTVKDITELEFVDAHGFRNWLLENVPALTTEYTATLGSRWCRRMNEWKAPGPQANLHTVDAMCVHLDIHLSELPDELWQERKEHKPMRNLKWERCRALEMLEEGFFPHEVAKLLGVSQSSVSYWKRQAS